MRGKVLPGHGLATRFQKSGWAYRTLMSAISKAGNVSRSHIDPRENILIHSYPNMDPEEQVPVSPWASRSRVGYSVGAKLS